MGRAQGNAAIHHSLGLSLIRQGLHSEAISYLKKAAEAKETDSRYIYVYAIALHSADNPTQALAILEKGFEQFPTSVDILQALISINRESGDLEKAKNMRLSLREITNRALEQSISPAKNRSRNSNEVDAH